MSANLHSSRSALEELPVFVAQDVLVDVKEGSDAVNQDRLLTTADAAELLNLHPTWLQKAARRKEVPHLRFGRRIRFERGELTEWVSTKRCGR
jgi:excisionase family DNA binding protein